MHTHSITATNVAPDPSNVAPEFGEWLTMDSLFIVHLGPNPDVIFYEEGRSEIEDITSSFMEETYPVWWELWSWRLTFQQLLRWGCYYWGWKGAWAINMKNEESNGESECDESTGGAWWDLIAVIIAYSIKCFSIGFAYWFPRVYNQFNERQRDQYYQPKAWLCLCSKWT